MLKTIESIFFDFDGVIADSVNVKTEAFAKMYESYGKEVKKQCYYASLSKWRYFPF